MDAHFAKPVIFILLVSLLAIPLSSAQGALLSPPLSPEHYPLIYSSNIRVVYDADGGTGGNGLLTATGTSLMYKPSSTDDVVDVDGTFEVTAHIVPSTGAFISGHLDVTGVKDDGGGWIEDYLSSNELFFSDTLTAFGFGPEDKFEFLFTQEGNMLANNNAIVGLIFSAATITEFSTPVFTSDFDNFFMDMEPYLGTSDTFWLPEPATLIVLAMAGGFAVLRRRRPHIV